MTRFAEYDHYDALGLAQLVRDGEVTPAELLDEAIARTDELNGELNAVVHRHDDLARSSIDAGLPDGPFRGVPFLLKDLHLQLEGTVTSNGSALYRDAIADHDSTLTHRYRDAGLVIFGKTNSPEFGLLPVTEPLAYGPTRNPWNTERTPGGSSGGSSAAVAAGIVPLANASDGGGSIRIPASCAGLVGLKPTRGRTPMGPDRGEGWAGQSVVHVVTRSVRDSAAMLDATAGSEPGDPYAAPHAGGSFLSQVERDPGGLRIAISTEKWGRGSVDPAVAQATEEVGGLLQELGHEVEEARPQFDQEAVARAGMTILAANTALTLENRSAELGREIRDGEVEPGTRRFQETAYAFTATDYARAVATNQALGRVLGRFHERYDVILAPTLASPPIPIGYLFEGDTGDRLQNFMGNTMVFNQTGQPAISLPLAWSADGLPIGIMFAAAFGEDSLLIRLAAQLERARPWFDRRPPVRAGAVA